MNCKYDTQADRRPGYPSQKMIEAARAVIGSIAAGLILIGIAMLIKG